MHNPNYALTIIVNSHWKEKPHRFFLLLWILKNSFQLIIYLCLYNLKLIIFTIRFLPVTSPRQKKKESNYVCRLCEGGISMPRYNVFGRWFVFTQLLAMCPMPGTWQPLHRRQVLFRRWKWVGINYIPTCLSELWTYHCQPWIFIHCWRWLYVVHNVLCVVWRSWRSTFNPTIWWSTEIVFLIAHTHVYNKRIYNGQRTR